MDDTKQAVNIYSLMDNELNRLHRMLETALLYNDKISNSSTDPFNRSASGSYSHQPSLNITVIYSRIIAVQDIILSSLSSSDEKIQEKVAELALMGKAENV